MGRSRAAASFLAASVPATCGLTAALLLAFPGFFSGARGEAVMAGAAVGWAVMLLTFALLLFTVDKSPNAFLGGYAGGFLVRLAALGLTALAAESGDGLPLAFVLTALVGSYFVLFLLEAWILSRLAALRAMAAGEGKTTR